MNRIELLSNWVFRDSRLLFTIRSGEGLSFGGPKALLYTKRTLDTVME